jgi:hypothetical protein
MSAPVESIASVPPIAARQGRVARLARSQRLASLGLLGLGSVVGATILWVGRGETFFADEWAYIVGRRGWGVDAFLVPHNEHITVLPAAVYKLLFVVVGLQAYWPYRFVLLLVHLACVGLVYRLARRRVGDPAAALTASFLLVLGSAWEMLLFPFEITLLGSVALGLLALDGLDRGGRRGDLVAVFALIGATCASAGGIPFLVGVAVELALRRAWRKLWIVGVPALVYGAWWLAYGRAASARDHLISHVNVIPLYVFHSIEAAVLAVLPLPASSVQLVVVLAALLVLVRVARHRAVLTPRLGGLAAAALAFWSLTGLARAEMSVGGQRYPYFGVVFLLLAVAELARGARFDRRIGLGICAVLAISAISNMRSLEEGGTFYRGHASTLRAELTALAAVDAPLPADFRPEPTWDPNLRMDTYRAAVAELGSATESLPALRAAPEDAREGADRVLLRVAPPAVRSVPTASCATHTRSIALAPHSIRVLVDAVTPFTLHVRLFASQFARAGDIAVAKGRHVILLPAVHSGDRWHAGTDDGAHICA